MTAPLYPQRIASWLPAQDANWHKYNYGHVLVIAGSGGFYGAAVHSSLSALRVGAGLVTVGVENNMNERLPLRYPDLMTWSMPARSEGWSIDELKQKIQQRKINTILIGPGLGQSEKLLGIVAETLLELSKLSIKVVVDADALAVLKDWKHKIKGSWVITPHAGEAKRMFAGDHLKLSAISDWVHHTGIICVLKHPRITIFNENGDTFDNTSGNTALAKAGTGDVLAGMIAGLLAQGCTAFQAAALASYMHGRAADLWCQEGREARSLLASDLITMIPKVFYELRSYA